MLILKKQKHKAMGNGYAVKMENSQIINLLTKPSYSVVSIDGYKSKFLEKAYKWYKKRSLENFVIIGHPKAFTPFSLQKLNAFITKGNRSTSVKIFEELL